MTNWNIATALGTNSNADVRISALRRLRVSVFVASLLPALTGAFNVHPQEATAPNEVEEKSPSQQHDQLNCEALGRIC
jgi:hypothetical protein